jgi:predicted AlkP superfamily pyrophosphatase or phosphodiesterase
MLPAAPKTLGRLSDVLVSALEAVSGRPNNLGFKPVKSAIVILVDGLGAANLKAANSHARFLNAQFQDKPLNTVFPTTTAAALTSFATGVQPNNHGFVGYRVFDRVRNISQNLLSGWTSYNESNGWCLAATISSRAIAQGAQLHFVGLSAYQRSGFTNVIMPDAEYHQADRVADRLRVATQLAATPGNVIYLYVPELDQTAHAYGVESFEWLNKLEDLDAQLRDAMDGLPSGVGVVLTADHGVVDVPVTGHIDLADIAIAKPKFVGGDTRNAYLYFNSEREAEDAQAALRDELGELCWICTPAELAESGWLGELTEGAAARVPDLYVLARKKVAIYHRDFSSAKSYKMVGHHGSISPEELQIPILRFGAWR